MANKRSQEHFRQVVEDIQLVDAKTANSIGYAPRFMACSSFPARKPISNEFVRTNGKRKLTLLAPSDIGLPYGAYPRLLIIYLSTQAKLTKDREIFLGNTETAFLRSLGKRSTGGKTGTLQSMREQTRKLFATSIIWTDQSDSSFEIENLNIVREASMIWMPHAAGAWESTLKLSRDYNQEIQKAGVPVDLRVTSILCRYTLAFDIYIWLTFRYFSLAARKLVPWALLESQFGNVYADKRQFKRNFIKAITWVSHLYPAANYRITERGLGLFPSDTHVSKEFCKRIYH